MRRAPFIIDKEFGAANYTSNLLNAALPAPNNGRCDEIFANKVIQRVEKFTALFSGERRKVIEATQRISKVMPTDCLEN